MNNDHSIYIYDDETYEFIQICKNLVQDICGRNELFIPKEGLDCPCFDVKVFDDRPDQLGFCQKISWDYFVIGINRDFIYEGSNSEKLRDTVIHEVAHLVNMFNYNDNGHGASFVETCIMLGSLSAAKSETLKSKASIHKKRMNGKNKRLVNKLLALTASNNKHESKLAQEKLNGILLRYNLKSNQRIKELNKLYGMIIHEEKLKEIPYYIVMMCKIISHHGVYPVVTKKDSGFYVEIAGDYQAVVFTKSLWDSILNNAMSAFDQVVKKKMNIADFLAGYTKSIYNELSTQKIGERYSYAIAKNNEELRALAKKIIYSGKVSNQRVGKVDNGSFKAGLKNGRSYSYKKMVS